MPVNAYAAMAAGQQLQPFTYEADPLGPYDIKVKISHCGICHSDLHLIDNDWQVSRYPLVPGHEIIGEIVEMGSSVKRFKMGQRVGIGWQRSSCGHCHLCLTGQEQLCPDEEDTCVGNHGGFSDAIVADGRFAFAIPEELESENAAPLLCGGITVFSPLRNHHVRPWMKVGVIGIGGLGHLALQFASAFGCKVTAFSSTPQKEHQARKLGADQFLSSTNPDEIEMARGSLDFIISTVFTDLEWGSYLNTLKPNGVLCFVAATPKPIPVPTSELILAQKVVTGSSIGSRAGIEEMLEFAARHQIRAQSEPLPLEKVNEGIKRLRENRARYRVVLTV
jgi:uncharacterized zinc-type alcohol dehydrogenase-like protein